MINHETLAIADATYSGLFHHLNMNIHSGDDQEIQIKDCQSNGYKKTGIESGLHTFTGKIAALRLDVVVRQTA